MDGVTVIVAEEASDGAAMDAQAELLLAGSREGTAEGEAGMAPDATVTL